MADKRKRETKVRPVTSQVTVLKETYKKDGALGLRVNGEMISMLKEMRFSLIDVLEAQINRAIERQKKDNINYLQMDIEFNIIKRSLTFTDNSVGLTKEEVAVIPLDVRFNETKKDINPEFDLDLSFLELATYYGTSLELLSVTKKETNWIHIDVENMINSEMVTVVEDEKMYEKEEVTKHLSGTGVKFTITNIPLAYEKGWALIPSPSKFDELRKSIALRFSETMQDFDLIVRLLYKARIVSDYDSSKSEESFTSDFEEKKEERSRRFWRKRR